jgi:mono/diheme cytochrome c family protein
MQIESSVAIWKGEQDHYHGGVALKGFQAVLSAVVLLFFIAAVAPKSLAGQKSDPAAGKKTYDILCTTCHGNTGKADGPAATALPVKPASFADAKYMKTLTDEHLFKVTKEGGSSVGKSPLMPPWGSQIDDQGIWNVVAYIRTLAKSKK